LGALCRLERNGWERNSNRKRKAATVAIEDRITQINTEYVKPENRNLIRVADLLVLAGRGKIIVFATLVFAHFAFATLKF
jgi:hypothetical protein